MSAHLRPRGTRLGHLIDATVWLLSGEWILDWSEYTANGGTVVAARSVWLTSWIYLPAFLAFTSLSVGRTFELDVRQGLEDVVETLPWIAAIFAGVYASFYTRFASQWTYLAGLYNQIVQAHLSMPHDRLEEREPRLAAWKAGFIEDAEDLHLAAKPMFLVVVKQWAAEPDVAAAYARNTVGGADRLGRLQKRLDKIWNEANAARNVNG